MLQVCFLTIAFSFYRSDLFLKSDFVGLSKCFTRLILSDQALVKECLTSGSAYQLTFSFISEGSCTSGILTIVTDSAVSPMKHAINILQFYGCKMTFV